MSTLRLSLPLVEGGSPVPHAPSPLSGAPDHPDRFLLSRHNEKLGERVASFSLPAVETCPGRSRGCSGVIKTGPQSKGSRRCYVLALYRRRPALLKGHRRNLAAVADLKAFARRMIREVRFRQIDAVRVHVAGDFHSAAYCKAWAFVAASLPEVRFFAYTRSWRVRKLRPWLECLAGLPNFALWYSCDGTTGVPEGRPPRVRLAWMALHAGESEPWALAEQIAACDLVFMDQPLRRLGLKTFGGVPVCPQERDPKMNCSRCGFCLPAAA